MRTFVRALLTLALFLAIPIVPFLFLGEAFEQNVSNWLRGDKAAAQASLLVRGAWVTGVLSVDIFLPIPSSAVSTWAGGALGLAAGCFASWVGMSAGGMLGFALARWLGDRFAQRRTHHQDLAHLALLSRRIGPLAIVVTRALPILAEACVLLMGASGMSWRRFLPPLLLSNFAVSAVYAACGAYFHGGDSFPLAVIASGTLPLAVALGVRKWFPQWLARSGESVSN